MKVLLKQPAVAAITMNHLHQRPRRVSIPNVVTPPPAETIAIA